MRTVFVNGAELQYRTDQELELLLVPVIARSATHRLDRLRVKPPPRHVVAGRKYLKPCRKVEV